MAIQKFLQKKYNVHYALSTIRHNRKDWGISPLYLRSRPLTDEEIDRVKEHFKGKTTPTSEDIQDFILKELKVSYEVDTINHKRKEWGFSANTSSATPLSSDQIDELEEAFKNQSPDNKQVQKFIRENFGDEYNYALNTISRNREKWGLKRCKAQSSSLSKEDIDELKEHYKDRPSPAPLELRSYLLEKFGVDFAPRTIRSNRDKKWGLGKYDPHQTDAYIAAQTLLSIGTQEASV